MLSIIIIAKNEQKVLPRLLKSIKKQTFKDYEIILSDAQSTDKTREIAKKYGCRIVKGGLPSIGRNNGAKASRGDALLFLDADAELPEDFLEKNINEIKKKNIDVASAKISPMSDNLLDKFFFWIFNIFIVITQYFFPHASGNCIYSTKKIFKKVKGFDETIKMAEDMDFVNRCKKQGAKFRILKSRKINSDMRRFEKDGRLNTARKYVIGAFYRVFIGEMHDSPFKYKLHGNVDVSS